MVLRIRYLIDAAKHYEAVRQLKWYEDIEVPV